MTHCRFLLVKLKALIMITGKAAALLTFDMCLIIEISKPVQQQSKTNGQNAAPYRNKRASKNKLKIIKKKKEKVRKKQASKQKTSRKQRELRNNRYFSRRIEPFEFRPSYNV
jgi:hypothetical protein